MRNFQAVKMLII